jgi:hypothetical protein
MSSCPVRPEAAIPTRRQAGFIDICLWTPPAKEWFDSSKKIGVLHVFSDVCNLMNEKGIVLSVVTEPAAMTPISMMVQGHRLDDSLRFSDCINPSSKVAHTSHVLKIGGIKLGMEGVEIWDPEVAWEEIGFDKVINALPIVESALQKRAAESYEQGTANAALGKEQKAFQTAYSSYIDHFGDMKGGIFISAIRDLAGLGLGLTPSGDDFLIGSMFALLLEGRSSSWETIYLIAKEAAPRTTSLSKTWLQAAAKGQAGMIWHWLFVAIKEGQMEKAAEYSSLIANVGHTSGSDSLTGFILTLKSLARLRSQDRSEGRGSE